MKHGQGQRYSRIERPQSIVRRTHQHGPGLDSRGAATEGSAFGGQQPSVLPLSLLSLCFMKGDFIMQDKATNPGKTSRPEKNPLDAKTTYHIGNRSFVVEPVFKEESPDTLGSVLLRLMKSESEKL